MTQTECHCDRTVISRVTIISGHCSEFSKSENNVFSFYQRKGFAAGPPIILIYSPIGWKIHIFRSLCLISLQSHSINLIYLKFIGIIFEGRPNLRKKLCAGLIQFKLSQWSFDRHINREEKKLAWATGTYWQVSEFIHHGAYKLQFLFLPCHTARIPTTLACRGT